MVKNRRKIRAMATTATLIFTAICLLLIFFSRRNNRNLDLILAVAKNNEAGVRASLAKGADPNAAFDPPEMTLSKMLRDGLLRRGVKRREWTVLMYAAENSNEQIVRRLLDAGGNLRSETVEGVTPLICAVHSRKHDAVELLVLRGSEVNYARQLFTPLIESVRNAPDDIDLSFLLAHGADPNVANSLGHTPLMFAVTHGDRQSVLMLLRAGANPNVQGRQGETALLYAAQYGELVSILSLLKAGANPKLRDNKGRTAEVVARLNGKQQAAQLIHDYYAPQGPRQ